MNSQLKHCVLQNCRPIRQTKELTWAVRAEAVELHRKDYEVIVETIAIYLNIVKWVLSVLSSTVLQLHTRGGH